MRSLRAWLVLVSIAAFARESISCGDPVHDEQVDALGPEPRGERTGPDHRPGQPCIVCHGGSGPGGSHFSIAGTVYATKGQAAPQPGAIVRIIDSRGSRIDLQANRVGNFYVDVEKWAPTSPYWVSVSYGDTHQEMQTQVGRDGSCGGCHFDPPGRTSPGRVYVVDPDRPQGDTQ